MESTELSFQKLVATKIQMHGLIMECKQDIGMLRTIKVLARLMQKPLCVERWAVQIHELWVRPQK